LYIILFTMKASKPSQKINVSMFVAFLLSE